MKFKIKHLEQRHGNYYFRYTIPGELQDILHRKEIRRKLETVNLKNATELCRVYSKRIHNLCISIRRSDVNSREAQQLLNDFFSESCTDPYALAELFNIDTTSHAAGKCRELASEYICSDPPMYMLDQDGFDSLHPEVIATEKKKKYFVDEMVDAVLAKSNMTIEKYSSDYYQMRHQTAEYCFALLTRLENKLIDVNNDTDHILRDLPTFGTTSAPNKIQANSQQPTQQENPNPIPIGQMAADYINEKLRLKKWAESTKKSEIAAVNLIVEYFYPETDIHQITRPQLLEFSNLLHKMPKHRNTRNEFAGMHIREIFKLECTDTISLKTQQNIMQYICTFFKWCSKAHHKNPISSIAEDIQIPDDPYTSPDQHRDNFEVAELVNMLIALKQLNTDSERWDWQYWIPIAELFCACRINELCQLYLSDIIQKDGIACFDINPFSRYGDKTVKNKFSIRLIPIHSTLLKLNFLGFVTKVRATGAERLFPNLTYEKGQGYKRKMGRWFNDIFKMEHMSTSTKKTFHSIRGNALTQLNAGNPNQVCKMCIAGHSRTNMTDAVYITPTLKHLQETIELLTYEFDIFSLLGKTEISDDVIKEQIKQLPAQNHYKGGAQHSVKE